MSSVLYQRGVYHPDGFVREFKYGITTLVTSDEGLKRYLDNIIKQLKGKHVTSVCWCRRVKQGHVRNGLNCVIVVYVVLVNCCWW